MSFGVFGAVDGSGPHDGPHRDFLRRQRRYLAKRGAGAGA